MFIIFGLGSLLKKVLIFELVFDMKVCFLICIILFEKLFYCTYYYFIHYYLDELLLNFNTSKKLKRKPATVFYIVNLRKMFDKCIVIKMCILIN